MEDNNSCFFHPPAVLFDWALMLFSLAVGAHHDRGRPLRFSGEQRWVQIEGLGCLSSTMKRAPLSFIQSNPACGHFPRCFDLLNRQYRHWSEWRRDGWSQLRREGVKKTNQEVKCKPVQAGARRKMTGFNLAFHLCAIDQYPPDEWRQMDWPPSLWCQPVRGCCVLLQWILLNP